MAILIMASKINEVHGCETKKEVSGLRTQVETSMGIWVSRALNKKSLAMLNSDGIHSAKIAIVETIMRKLVNMRIVDVYLSLIRCAI